MRKQIFKRVTSLLLCAVMCLAMLPTGQWSAASGGFDVTVISPDGIGVNMRLGPDRGTDKARPDPIPIQTVLHIDEVQYDGKNRPWGHTVYDGTSGWVYLKQETDWNGQKVTPEPQPEQPTPEGKLLLTPDQIPPKAAGAYAHRLNAFRMENGGSFMGITFPPDGYSSFDFPIGQYGAALFDLDGDRSPELYLLEVTGEGEAEESIWTVRGDQAEEIFRNKLHYYGVRDLNSTDIVRVGDKVYYRVHGEGTPGVGAGFCEWGTLYAMENGAFVNVLEYFKETGDMGEDETGSNPGTKTVKLYGVEQDSAKFDALMAQYQPSEVCDLFSEGAGCPDSYVGYVGTLLEQLETRAASGAVGADVMSHVAYMGDPARCKMSAGMALAYAEALETSGLPYAMMIEPNGDGLPLMAALKCSPEYAAEEITDPHVWEYRDGHAVDHDFFRDYPDGQWIDGMNLYTYKDSGGGLKVTFNACGAMMPHYGTFCYRIREGRLDLAGSITEDLAMYGAERDSKSYSGICKDRENIVDTASIGSFGDVGTLYADVTASDDMVAALRRYAATAGYYTYPQAEIGADQYAQAVGEAAAEAVGGQVSAIHKLADGVYYVVITVDGVQKGVLVRGVTREGQIVWQPDSTDEQLPAQDVLADRLLQQQSVSNIQLDYGKLQEMITVTDISSYLQEVVSNVDGLTCNDAAKKELVAFAESALAELSTSSVSGKRNRLTLDAAGVQTLADTAAQNADAIRQTLEQAGVVLNKPITVLLRIVWENVDVSAPCQLTFSQDLVDALGSCRLQLLLGDARHYIRLTPETLKELVAELGQVTLQLICKDGVYTFSFLDENGQVLEQVSAALVMGLPAESATSTVMVSYAGGSDNWGGQFDPATKVIEFETSWSGQYEVLENNINIADIADLSADSQEAIAFMVSKGYLTLDGERFNPDASLSRYDFTHALVGMFFALDRTLTAEFPDVPADSPDYPYVASAQKDAIVTGFPDGTFGGDRKISREQLLVIAARTLENKKGYTLPADPMDYLSTYPDGDLTGQWAQAHAALAVREGLIDLGGDLQPQGEVSREQAAVTLYRLFLLLHDVPPVALELPADTDDGPVGIIVAVLGGVAAVVAVGAAIAMKKKKN